VTPEAESKLIAKLENEMKAHASQHARNAAERAMNLERAEELRRDIERIRLGHHKVGHP
jgi:hypothetical protein